MFWHQLFDNLILILFAEKQESDTMETLEEIKNHPLHTSNMASSFVCSKSRDGEAFWFKSHTSCSSLNEWSISISLAPSISETVFVYSTTWNLLLVPSRSCDSSFVMFLRPICNLESSSFMAFLDLAKTLIYFWNILDILWSFAHNLLYFFLKFSSVTIACLKIDGSDTTC